MSYSMALDNLPLYALCKDWNALVTALRTTSVPCLTISLEAYSSSRAYRNHQISNHIPKGNVHCSEPSLNKPIRLISEYHYHRELILLTKASYSVQMELDQVRYTMTWVHNINLHTFSGNQLPIFKSKRFFPSQIFYPWSPISLK